MQPDHHGGIDMRAINENTLEILKSQKMIGQDKFNYNLRLEGVDYYTDVKETKTNVISNNSSYGDMAIRSDGKILLATSLGVNIYLSVINSEQEMMTAPNSGNAQTLFYSVRNKLGQRYHSLLRLKNGKILLFISDKGNKTDNIPFTIKCFESANGLGDDFVLKSTLYSQDRMNTGEEYTKNLLTKASQADDGAIFIAGSAGLISYSGYDKIGIKIFKSIDNGTSWSAIYTNDVGFAGVIYYETMRNLVIIGNTIFFTMIRNNGGAYADTFISIDGGISWSFYISSFANLPYSSSNWHHMIDFFAAKDGFLYMILPNAGSTEIASIYKMKLQNKINYADIDNFDNWAIIYNNVLYYNTADSLFLVSNGGVIHFFKFGTSSFTDIALIREEYSAPLNISSISISKGKGGANSLSITADNTNGSLNPNNPDGSLYGIINLNKQIIVKMGYGEEMIETFTGLIDEFSMKSYPHVMDISCRDHMKKALDQTITEGNQNTVTFENTAIESIFGYLCYLAGIETGTIEATGIKISKIFSWQSYADAFQFLADLASFEYGADEYGKLYFRRDFQPNNMAIAYTFEEGVDITSMSYKLSDDDIYYRVKAYGKSGDTVIVYDAPFVDAVKYNILPQKILKVDATEASTIGELRTIAERALYLMNSRTAIVEFEAVAVPWLQVGDFIQVYERSSMASGIFRISSMTINMTPKRFTMRLSCYYYGDSIVSGELPTETATQTADPNLNLIPEMTSNTAPSGIARASSIYNGTYEPWQALNSSNADYYWNSIASSGWIEYQFTDKKIVDKYMLKARQALEYNDAMPKNWTFEAFDGVSWIILDSRSNQTAWGINEQRQYLLTNTKAYSKYRLNVSAANGYNRLQLEQLAMYFGGGA